MVYKNFEEFNQKIHPFYGKGNFTNNNELFQFIEEKEGKTEEKKKKNLSFMDNIFNPKEFYELAISEQKKLEIEDRINYMKSIEAFEEYNPNKYAIYRGKETKAYIEWKKQFK